MPRLRKGDLLTADQAKEIDAAIMFEAGKRNRYANQAKVSYQRLNRMLRGEEVLTESYAKLLNALVEKWGTSGLSQAA